MKTIDEMMPIWHYENSSLVQSIFPFIIESSFGFQATYRIHKLEKLEMLKVSNSADILREIKKKNTSRFTDKSSEF